MGPDVGSDMGPDMAPDMPEEPDVPLVPCEAFPEPDSLPGALRYESFQGYVNPMLIRSCTTANGCHALQGEGGGLWFLRNTEDECETTWNYLTSRWFVNPQQTISSPILLEPLGQQALGDFHGGNVVFEGNSDCDYVMLKAWIEDNFDSYLRFSGCE